MRQFASSWFKGSHSTWLEYSVEKDAAYCLCCYLFKNEFVYETTGDFYASKGFRGWNKALERFRLHVDKVNSVLHKCYNKMLDLSNRRQSIQVVLDKHSEKSKRFLRWHGDNHPDVGKVILEKAPQNDALTCHMIQKDIVNACTKETLKVIIARWSVTKMERVLQAPDTVCHVLCQYKRIGRMLREETQAKVTVADSVPGSDERVIIISSSSRKLSGRTNCNHCNESQVTREENEGMEPHYIGLPKMLSKGRKGDVIQRLRSETWDSIRGLPDWRTLHYMSYAHKLMLVKITLWHLSSIHPKRNTFPRFGSSAGWSSEVQQSAYHQLLLCSRQSGFQNYNAQGQSPMDSSPDMLILALLYYGLSWIPGRTRGSYSLATSIRSDSGELTRILEVRLHAFDSFVSESQFDNFHY
ncbi:hypothetical protein BC332_05293 [Capsicum chinense]|nr:hypothetical protein BC332_05293 [Capsicum chinense]